MKPDEEGVVSFEIPRSTYTSSENEKKHSEKMIVEATYEVNTSGTYEGQPYRSVVYVMSMPL